MKIDTQRLMSSRSLPDSFTPSPRFTTSAIFVTRLFVAADAGFVELPTIDLIDGLSESLDRLTQRFAIANDNFSLPSVASSTANAKPAGVGRLSSPAKSNCEKRQQ